MSEVKLYHGDCLEVMGGVADNSIDLILTDPPYWHNKQNGKPKIGTKTLLNSSLYTAEGKMMKDMSDFNPSKINEFLNSIKRTMKLMNCYIFCNDSQISSYGKWAEDNNFHFSVLIWRKPLSVINTNRFSQNVEFICRIYEYGTGLNFSNNKNDYDRVYNDKPIRGNQKLHPTQKPISLIERFIRLSSKENDLIFDPFMGSGSTGVACVNTNRNFIGIEKDDKYFKIAEDRINKARETIFDI